MRGKMTEQEYNTAINRIYHSKIGENPTEIEKLLEQLYTIKPVRLSWYIAKVKHVWKNNQSLKEVFPILENKGWHLYPYPGIKELTELYLELVNSCQDTSDMQRHKLLYMNLLEDKAKEEEEWLAQINNQFQQAKIDFIGHPKSPEAAGRLLDFYFIFHTQIIN